MRGAELCDAFEQFVAVDDDVVDAIGAFAAEPGTQEDQQDGLLAAPRVVVQEGGEAASAFGDGLAFERDLPGAV